MATDGFIVYDIQEEPGRAGMPRPFPFRRLTDSSAYAALLARTSGKQCLVYKCVADEQFDHWIQQASQVHGHSAVNLVGRASSDGTYVGPTISEAMEKVQKRDDLKFGCVCIAERHTLESAKARGKDYPTEHFNMLRKQKAGAQWFISQAVYDTEPTIRLLKDYAALCRQHGIVPKKVVLTFAPVSRIKTMNFIKWLGVNVPPKTEAQILEAETPVDKSVEILCDHLKHILQECAGIGVPLGVSCESVSIYKAEIDGVHELFRQLQGILLDSRGSPWKVTWVEVMLRPNKEKYNAKNSQAIAVANDSSLQTFIAGALLGGLLVGTGVVLGSNSKKR